MSYDPENPPEKYNADYFRRELQRISDEVSKAQKPTIQKESVTPTRPRDGNLRRGDANNWNPGGGDSNLVWFNNDDGYWYKLLQIKVGVVEAGQASLTYTTYAPTIS